MALTISHTDRDGLPNSNSPSLTCPLPCSNSVHHEADHGPLLLKTFQDVPQTRTQPKCSSPARSPHKISSFDPQPPLCPTLGCTTAKHPQFPEHAPRLRPGSLLCLKSSSLSDQHCKLPLLFQTSAVTIVSRKHPLTHSEECHQPLQSKSVLAQSYNCTLCISLIFYTSYNSLHI